MRSLLSLIVRAIPALLICIFPLVAAGQMTEVPSGTPAQPAT